MYKILKFFFFQYILRISCFLVVFHFVVRPAQSAVNQKIIAPLINEKLDVTGSNFLLHTNQNHTQIFSLNKNDKKIILSFSMPFGQFYFFLIFFLWFKPPLLIRALSIYNFLLIPAYTIAVYMFLMGYGIFGFILIINEKLFRLIYFFIFLLKIFRPKQFKVIFSG